MSYLVKFENVSKRYPRGGPRYASVRHDMVAGMQRLGQRMRGKKPEPRGRLALEDLSFEVGQGESFALVGPNGAGKTTALKLISRISYPSAGRVRVRGRVAALIEVSSGVHPELTARENIWLYGQILGMNKADIRKRFDQIVDFAELGHVLDSPVKLYSSGMQLRLGFSIAAHLDPEVFLVDEALAVGDAGFQTKCVDRMTALVDEGRTLIFVSHNLPAVESICERGLFINEGKMQSEGPVREIIAEYLDWVEDRRTTLIDPKAVKGPLKVTGATCHDLQGREKYRFKTGEGIEIRIRFTCDFPIDRPFVSVGITDGRPGTLVNCSMLTDGRAPDHVGTEWECRLRIDELPFLSRLYQVYCEVHGHEGRSKLMKWSQVTAFRIMAKPVEGPVSLVSPGKSGAVELPYEWSVVDAGASATSADGTLP